MVYWRGTAPGVGRAIRVTVARGQSGQGWRKVVVRAIVGFGTNVVSMMAVFVMALPGMTSAKKSAAAATASASSNKS